MQKYENIIAENLENDIILVQNNIYFHLFASKTHHFAKNMRKRVIYLGTVVYYLVILPLSWTFRIIPPPLLHRPPPSGKSARENSYRPGAV